MNDQKIEDLLNLALDATESERQKSAILNIGYDPFEKRWDLIIRYSGDLSPLRALDVEIIITELSSNYAIINIPEIYIGALADIPEIEYIEKPKRLYFAVAFGRDSSCINAVQTAQYDLTGQGVIVAVIDSGVNYTHPDFCNEDGTTRILNIWDQSVPGSPPAGYYIGTEYNADQINEALSAADQTARYDIVPTRDLSGHGTAVLGIAAGNGRASRGEFRGVAYNSDIIVVKLGIPGSDSFPRTTELMQAIDYVIKKGLEYQRPIAINLSFGNTYGPHDGTSLLEAFIDNVSNIGRTSICVGTGNEGSAAGHTAGNLADAVPYQDIELAISSNEFSINAQIWKSYADDFDISIIHPSGRILGPIQEISVAQRFVIENTELLIHYGVPSPYSIAQEIFIDFIPTGTYLDSGIWILRLIPNRIVDGDYDIWLPSSAVLNTGTRFYRPVPATTITIPSTARKVISVGAYDSRYNTYAAFSGRGYTRNNTQVKPDLVAPGVDVTSTSVDGGYANFTGTSFATPFVTGSAALLMQYGILDRNDPYLYGEKIKAYLQRGAKPLLTASSYPNNTLGYGTLCVRDSIE